MNKPRILITGGTGQLGMEFKDLSATDQLFEWIILGREHLDITDHKAITSAFKIYQPDYCINCAAFTAVDLAESHPDEAFEVNDLSVGHLASTCDLYGTPLIHFSTDYVYHSVVDRPILETDPCLPQGIYAKSKKAGEDRVKASGCPYIIFRVSWLYSAHGNNFVKTMLKLGGSRDEVQVVTDQYGSPTYARDLARASIDVIGQLDRKSEAINQVYNYSNAGTTNWHNFAATIFRLSLIDCKVRETTTRIYNAPAQRPMWSVLSKEKIVDNFGLTIHPWEKSLKECLDLLIGKI